MNTATLAAAIERDLLRSEPDREQQRSPVLSNSRPQPKHAMTNLVAQTRFWALGVVCLALGIGGHRGPAFDFVVARNAHFMRIFLLVPMKPPCSGTRAGSGQWLTPATIALSNLQQARL